VEVAVGTTVAGRPPHRSVHALLTHTALILDVWRETGRWDEGVGLLAKAGID
jgi:hypothetical protein